MALLGWCSAGQHDKCKRTYQKWYMAPNRARGEPPYKIIYLDEWAVCSCLVRSCQCYVKPADRVKPRKPRRKK